ncbi:MAG: hypothetical protein R2710_30350 [Acidimicrobiales bacterium]
MVGTVSITAPAPGRIDPRRRVAVSRPAPARSLVEVDDSLGLEVIASTPADDGNARRNVPPDVGPAGHRFGRLDRHGLASRPIRPHFAVRQLRGPAGNVLGVRASSGRRLAAGTTDGLIWLWQCHDDRFEPRP